MEIREAFGVQHVHFVHKQHPRYQLGYSLVNVAVHHLVDLSTKLVCNQGWRREMTESESDVIFNLRFSTCDFCLFRLHQLSHH